MRQPFRIQIPKPSAWRHELPARFRMPFSEKRNWSESRFCAATLLYLFNRKQYFHKHNQIISILRKYCDGAGAEPVL